MRGGTLHVIIDIAINSAIESGTSIIISIVIDSTTSFATDGVSSTAPPIASSSQLRSTSERMQELKVVQASPGAHNHHLADGFC